ALTQTAIALSCGAVWMLASSGVRGPGVNPVIAVSLSRSCAVSIWSVITIFLPIIHLNRQLNGAITVISFTILRRRMRLIVILAIPFDKILCRDFYNLCLSGHSLETSFFTSSIYVSGCAVNMILRFSLSGSAIIFLAA